MSNRVDSTVLELFRSEERAFGGKEFEDGD